ncbi:MAG: hypothetical protein ABIP48_29960 [Planctomycetota bacterium]
MGRKGRKRVEKSGPERPYWLPRGEFWDRVPEGVKEAAEEVLGPAYRELVENAPSELERLAGTTVVHLAWLEICDQLHLAENVSDRQSIASILNDPDEMIARHLQLVYAKSKATVLLMGLRMARQSESGVGETPRLAAPEEYSTAPFPLPYPDALHSVPAEPTIRQVDWPTEGGPSTGAETPSPVAGSGNHATAGEPSDGSEENGKSQIG